MFPLVIISFWRDEEGGARLVLPLSNDCVKQAAGRKCQASLNSVAPSRMEGTSTSLVQESSPSFLGRTDAYAKCLSSSTRCFRLSLGVLGLPAPLTPSASRLGYANSCWVVAPYFSVSAFFLAVSLVFFVVSALLLRSSGPRLFQEARGLAVRPLCLREEETSPTAPAALLFLLVLPCRPLSRDWILY